MQHCLSFTPTIQTSLRSKNNIAKWDEAVELFEQKQYLPAIYAVFDYLDESILTHYANPEKTRMVIPQGSAVVIVSIEENQVNIKAPFVKLPADKQLPILRKCSEINFSSMSLPQMLLENDTLTLEFNMPIDLCEPNKLYDVLRDIAINADKYDDEFVDKFGAVRLMEPQATHYSDAERENIRQTCMNIAKEALEYAAYYEGKRDLVLTSDALLTGINRIKYYADPTGMILTKLNDAASAFFNRNNDMAMKIKTMRTALESVKNISEEESKDTFFVTYRLIPTKGNASRGYLENWIAGQYKDAETMFNKQNYPVAVSYSLYTLYIILADFNIDDDSRQAIEYSLKKAAGLPFAEAAPILFKAVEFFYLNEDETLEMEEEEQDVHVDAAMQEAQQTFAQQYMSNLNSMMDQYKSMLGNFMQGFTKN